MNNIIKHIFLLSLLVLSISFLGCSDDPEVELPELTAGFTHTIEPTTGTVTFINTSENADKYSWDFGDGTTSTEINPIKVYPTGTYNVILTATNAAGASGSFSDQIVIFIPENAAVPITFDLDGVDYSATVFNGVSFEVVSNPDMSGSNPNETNVGAITNSGAAFEGFFFDLGMPLNLSTNNAIRINFWSNTPTTILLKLEEGTGAPIEVTASHGGTGWEEVYFLFNSMESYNRFTMFVDGPGSTAGTFYIDDIVQVSPDDIPCMDSVLDIPMTFECDATDFAAKIVGNVSFTVVDNPDMTGNGSAKVGQITNVGANWENAFFNLDVPVDFSSQKGITMNFWADQPVPILLKFEDGTAGPVEMAASHNGSGWEELDFFLNADASYNDMVVFVDGPGTTAGTFYIDDIVQNDGTPPDPPFDGGLLKNGDFESLDGNGNVLNWIQGIDDNNPAPIVMMDGNTYYSIDVTSPTPGAPFNINVSQKLEITEGETYVLKFDAWSDRDRTIVAGIGLSGGSFANNSTTVNITSTRTTYSLTLLADGFGATDARVLFDLAEEAGIVNIDNVALTVDNSGGGSGGCSDAPVAATMLPLDFEGCESFISTFASIADGVTTNLVANPNPTGINTSANVMQVVRAMGINRWGGLQNSFPAGTIDITTNTFKVKVYSGVSDVTYRFELALDPQTDPPTGNPAPVFRTVTGGANEWVEIEFTFENLPGTPTTYNLLVIKPDNPEGSDGEVTSEERVFYFDDLRLD